MQPTGRTPTGRRFLAATPLPPPPVVEPEVSAEEELTPPSPKVAALPSTAPDAPTISDLKAVLDKDGAAHLTWTGTTVTVWHTDQGAGGNVGYNLYRHESGAWALLEVEVYPPTEVPDSAVGDVLGVAPVYVLPSGAVVGGAIQSVTLV